MMRWLLVAMAVQSVAPQAGWLDRPMVSWNRPDAGVPSAATKGSETQSALERRCGSSTLASSSTADSVRKAGWVPFLHLDRVTAGDGVEVLGGMSAAGLGCEATVFNVFVFVAGRFAGSLSPDAMTQSKDGAAGAVRLTGADMLTAEFARYAPTDPECCPSSRVRVSYRIDRASDRPTLVATDARRVR